MLELGSGTGKLSFFLKTLFNYIIGIDASPHMVSYANSKKERITLNGDFIIADFRYSLFLIYFKCFIHLYYFRYLPFRKGLFLIIIAGWSLSYLKVNFQFTEPKVEQIIKGEPNNNTEEKREGDEEEGEETRKGWAYQLRRTLQECKRVMKEEGLLIILESRGVAYDEPTRDGILFSHILLSFPSFLF